MSDSSIKPGHTSRRDFLGKVGLIGAGALSGGLPSALAATAAPKKDQDVDILNFALNLEYLEAAFYLAAVGRLGELKAIGGNAAIILPNGTGKQPRFDGTRPMDFGSSAVKAYAEEIAEDEFNHVKFLVGALGSRAVPRPVLDIGPAFGAAAQAATKAPAALAFSPYSNVVPGTRTSVRGLYFLHGAFIFEDVGVTAYKGAAKLITNPDYLEAAAGILSVEAYHAGEVRTLLYRERYTQTGFGVNVKTLIGLISALRGSVGGGKDEGIVKTVRGVERANIIPTDANSISYSRSVAEVLRIVYLGGAGKGGFFPNGLNGTFK
ncbi:MAG: ferritin-like domain-containing protein [Pseudopedobacter sp.]|nr:ferritin-like domain-containing protein [Deinococcales bacterium]